MENSGKRNFVLAIGCLGSVALSLGILYFPWMLFYAAIKDPPNKPTSAKPSQSTAHPTSAESVPKTQTTAISAPLLPPSLTRIQDVAASEGAVKVMEKIEALKNAKINVYGVVVDENGLPLADVKVTWSLGSVPSYQINSGTVTTNRGGEFQVSGVISPTIHFTPRKEGHLAHEESVGTWFADVPSSKESPLKLIMRKE